MKLELSETMQIKYCRIPFTEVPRINEIIETEGRIEITGGWEKGRIGSYCLVSTELLLGLMEKVKMWIVMEFPLWCSGNESD